MLVPIALGAGGWILIVVALLILVGVVYGFYTRAGSGIAAHRLESEEQAAGAEGPSEASGKDEGEGSTLDRHGTR